MKRLVFSSVLVGSLACGEEEPPPPPTKLEVQVMDGLTNAPLAGARVLVEGLASLQTDANGKISVELDAGRHALRAEAAGFLGAPGPYEGPRIADVIAHETSTDTIALWRRPGTKGSGSVSGKVTPAAEGVLVVARGTENYSALTDATGAFEIGGVVPAQYRLTAYVKGSAFEEVTGVAVQADATTRDVEISNSGAAEGRIEGTISGTRTGTTAIVVVEPDSAEAVPGLGGFGETSFVLEGAPKGTFRIEAALEPDAWVVDPELIHQDARPSVVVSENNPPALALPLVPTLEGVTTRTSSAGTVLSWNAYDGAEFYVIEVVDAFERTVLGGFDTRRNFRLQVLHPTTSLVLQPATPFEPGTPYRARVYAAENTNTGSVFKLIAGSEMSGGEFVLLED